MSKFILVLILIFSQNLWAGHLDVILRQEGNEVTISFKENVANGQILKKFGADLKEENIDLDNSNLLIDCDHSSEFYACKIKTTLKSHAYRNVLLLPTGDMVITLKGKLAWTFSDLLTGQSAQCYINYYAEEFNITICPNTVDIVIHAKEIQ